MGKTVKRIDPRFENKLRQYVHEADPTERTWNGEFAIESLERLILSTIVKPHRFGSDVRDRRGCVQYGDSETAKRLGKRSLHRAMRLEAKAECRAALEEYALGADWPDDSFWIANDESWESDLIMEELEHDKRMADRYGMSLKDYHAWYGTVDWGYVDWCENKLESADLSLEETADLVRAMYREMMPEHIFRRSWFEWLTQDGVVKNPGYFALAMKYEADLIPLAA